MSPSRRKVVGVVAPVAAVALYKGRKDASSGDEAMEKNAKEHGERHDQDRSKVPLDSGMVRIADYDPIFGLDFVYAMYKGLKSHTELERMQARFDSSGANTSEIVFSLGGTLFATIEPEKLKSILSLRFKDRGLGNERKQVMIPFLGEGILETDGGQSDDWSFLALFITNPRLKKQYKIVHDFVDTLIEKAMANRERYEKEKEHSNRRIFIYELFNQTTNAAKIRAESLNILLVGRDTTASLLSNVWFELSRSPAVYARLRAGIDTLNNEIPTFEQIKSMKYLRALLNESLRLYPVVPENARLAVCDTVLPVGGGPDGESTVFVAKGQLAYWSKWTMHRRKDLYGEDAEEFRPERWLDGEVSGEKGLRVG
ncbi:hypothetical protein OEA41_002208 [Lepraria neglecta]|uniref:Cytochrome P450 n=1 Tax=Lepraria neglecta TaxID=209136 RepID=A0AAE0DM74_9LECA|nr:hypothetical protein OEA41_002208 [Lepraria neglecta]